MNILRNYGLLLIPTDFSKLRDKLVPALVNFSVMFII